MDTNERFTKLLQAPPGLLARIDDLLSGRDSEPSAPIDLRLFTVTDTARELNISRATVQRMLADGRLPAIETRAGRRRIPSAALTAFVSEGGRK